MAVLDCDPGIGAPDLVWKASGMRRERSSGGETVIRGYEGLVGVGKSGNNSGEKARVTGDELRPARQAVVSPLSLNTCVTAGHCVRICAEVWAVFECQSYKSYWCPGAALAMACERLHRNC